MTKAARVSDGLMLADIDVPSLQVVNKGTTIVDRAILFKICCDHCDIPCTVTRDDGGNVHVLADGSDIDFEKGLLFPVFKKEIIR